MDVILEQCADIRNMPQPSRATSQSVARALAVLDLLASATGALGVREVARQLHLAPSIVQRLMRTLAAGGYVEQTADAPKYRIGYRAFQVGRSYLTQSNLYDMTLPELRAIAERDQVNMFLGVLRDRAVVYLAAVQSSGPIAIRSAPGARAYLHSTAFGKALLAPMSDAEVAAILGEPPFPRLTAKTKATLEPLLADLREVRLRGFAVADEENFDNVFSFGAVIRDAAGEVVAAISGAVPRHPLRDDEIGRLCGLVSAAAQRISYRLGAAGRPRPAPVPELQAI